MRWLAVIALLVSVWVIIAYSLSDEPHSFTSRECPRCHLNVEMFPGSLIAPITTLCKKCHSNVMRASSHPVDIVPVTVKVPADLPLKDGRVTCNTCHNIHIASRLVFGIKSHMLRRPTADIKYFCVACHGENMDTPGHEDLLLVAHEAGKYRVTDTSGTIDRLSVECLSCHDGTIATDVDYRLGEGIWMHFSGAHPIGVSYMGAMMNEKELAPLGSLDRRLRLFDGKIGCATCHDMFSTVPGKLVMSSVRLCTSCHINK